MAGAPKIVRTGDNRIDRSLQAVSAAIHQLGEPVVDDGVVISGISVSTTTRQVSHGLGRKPLGWFVIDRTADVRVWRDATADKTSDKTLPLVANTSGTVSIWVF